MAAPTVINTVDSGVLNSSVSTTFLNVPASQAGDVIVVYVFTNASGIVGDTPIPDHVASVDFAYDNEFQLDNGLSIYALTDPTGATNWDIECPLRNGPVGAWAAGYIHLRNCVAGSNANESVGGIGNPATVDITTAGADSGVLALVNDAAGINKASANWAATDGYDPDSGSSVYFKQGVTGFYGFYAAYFPDISTANTYTFAMSGGTYSYTMSAYEIGTGAGVGSWGTSGVVSWFRA